MHSDLETKAFKIIDDLLTYLKDVRNGGMFAPHTSGNAGQLAKEIIDRHSLITYRDRSNRNTLVDISLEGLQVLKIGGIENYLNDKAEKAQKKEQRQDELITKEFQKINLEIEDLVNKVADYAKVKNQAKWAIICAALSAIAALIALLK